MVPHLKVVRPPLTLTILLALSACGDGGSSGGVTSTPTPPATPATFTSFSAMQKSATTQITGSTREGSYTGSTTSNVVNSVTQSTTGNATVDITLDSSGNQTQVSLTGSQSSISFSTTDGSTSSHLSNLNAPGAILAESGNKQNLMISGDYNYLGYNYQDFGVWATGLGTGSGHYGAFSVGATTPGASVPTTGSATYNGYAGGLYASSTGAVYAAVGSAMFTANFANRNVSVSTSNTEIADLTTNSVSSAPYLNFSGNLTWSSGSSSISGAFSTTTTMPNTNYYLSGSASGSFYGPSASELGGTFTISGAGANFIGAFGGKQ